MTDRAYDLVVWGATGFTGRLVAEHLAERYERTDLDWAIAGRDREGLAALREELAGIDPAWSSLDLLTGDAFDRERLGEIAERTRVVCAAVGPYANYGSGMVEACLDRGTNYCDVSGEIHWIRRMIDEHHEEARERGVRIVHACGFDSIPSDLGTAMVQRHVEEQFGTSCSSIGNFVSTSSLALSGGTIAGMVGTYEARSEDPAVRRALEDPRSLTPGGEHGGQVEPRQRWPRYESDVDQWTAPFLMAVINEKVVHRSNALLGYPWGRDFEYSEVTPTGSGLPGMAVATGVSGGLALGEALTSVAPLRRLIDRFVLPEPGEGPSRETIEGSSFEARLVGSGRSPGSGDEFTVDGVVAGDRDPYGATGWMAAEAAVCLAFGETDTPLEGGVLTPASGIGTPLVDRLRDVGMTFTLGAPDASGA
jgi:short subunit dehydrogenase-like uncharacterized protein